MLEKILSLANGQDGDHKKMIHNNNLKKMS